MRLLFEVDYKNYKENGTVGSRPSARGIIIRDGLIAMIYSRKYDFFTFPGGGVKPGESNEEALIREVREEAGLAVIPETIREFGMVIRKEKGKYDDLFIQENYYYLCDAKEQPVGQERDEREIDEDIVLRWVRPEDAVAVNRTHDHHGYKREWMTNLFERDERLFGILREERFL